MYLCILNTHRRHSSPCNLWPPHKCGPKFRQDAICQGIINSNLEPLARARSLRGRSAPMSRSSSPLNFPFKRFSWGRLESDIVVQKRVVDAVRRRFFRWVTDSSQSQLTCVPDQDPSNSLSRTALQVNAQWRG